MASFQTGSASDVNDLLGKLRAALVAEGWSLDHNGSEGASGGIRVHLSKGGITLNFRTGFNNEVPVQVVQQRSARQGGWDWSHGWWEGPTYRYYQPNWLAFNLGTSTDLGKSWHIQPGAPGASEGKGLASMIVAPGAIPRFWLHILDSPLTVILLAEVYPGKCEHIAFGVLALAQEIQAGGEWFSGSRPVCDHYRYPWEVASGWVTTQSSYSYPSTEGGPAALCRLVDSRWGAPDKLDGWNHSLMLSGVPNAWYSSVAKGVPMLDDFTSNPSSSGFHNAVTRSYLEDEGRSILHPIHAYKGDGAGGFTPLGTVGHIARTSLRPYVMGDPVAGVGETYVAYPNHSRVSPWNDKELVSVPPNPADQVGNFFGTGIAVRRPV